MTGQECGQLPWQQELVEDLARSRVGGAGLRPGAWWRKKDAILISWGCRNKLP